MKIKVEELKNIYRNYIRSHGLQSRSSCPPLENIYHALKGKFTRRYRAKIISHISHCRYCLDDFDILRSILFNEKITLDEIIKVMPRQKMRNIRLKEESIGYGPQNRYTSIFFRRIFSGFLAILAAIFLAIGLFTNRQLLKDVFFSDHNRSPRKHEIVLLYPDCNKEHSISALIFKWEAFPNSDYYTIEIFDETLLPIWKSPAIFEPIFKFSAEVPDILKPRKKYFWIVTGYASNLVQFESKVSCFYLK